MLFSFLVNINIYIILFRFWCVLKNKNTNNYKKAYLVNRWVDNEIND